MCGRFVCACAGQNEASKPFDHLTVCAVDCGYSWWYTTRLSRKGVPVVHADSTTVAARPFELPGRMSIGDACIPVFDITEEEYVNTPSRKDGIDEETESKLRIYGCELVQECGVLLRLYVLLASRLARLGSGPHSRIRRR